MNRGIVSGRFQSPMSIITVSAYLTMRGVTSLIVKDWTRVYDQDLADEELQLVGRRCPSRKSLERLTLYYLKNPLTLCQARYVVSRIVCSHFLG